MRRGTTTWHRSLIPSAKNPGATPSFHHFFYRSASRHAPSTMAAFAAVSAKRYADAAKAVRARYADALAEVNEAGNERHVVGATRTDGLAQISEQAIQKALRSGELDASKLSVSLVSLFSR